VNIMSEKMKVPRGLIRDPSTTKVLELNGVTVIESCLHTKRKEGSMFLEKHMLLFVLKGKYLLKFGDESYLVNEREMVLVHKSIVVYYDKYGDNHSSDQFDYMMFFFEDEVISDFIKTTNLESLSPSSVTPISVYPMNKRFLGYNESIKPLLDDSKSIRTGLVKLKLLELLYDVADTDVTFLYQFLHLRQKETKNITKVVEENIFNPVSVNDLAYLSGRSISTFKRAFKEIYNSTPLKWIRNRRLDKASELLMNAHFSITEVCFSTGFENLAHFSRVFKKDLVFPRPIIDTLT
jgi:AraC family transcriptional regulator, exoenzyme S synthesis regulatory protein ExsA